MKNWKGEEAMEKKERKPAENGRDGESFGE